MHADALINATHSFEYAKEVITFIYTKIVYL